MNRYKMWAFISALLSGGALMQFGCGINKQMALILAILQEDLFG
jgi:hypothetical protein